jgi:hypothetical protein
LAPALARTAAGRVVELLSPGVALAEEPYAAWAEPARQELRELLRRARYALAEAARATGDAHLAARAAGDAMVADSFDEGAHRLFMSACAAAGERAKALETYARLSSRLAEELGADPAPDTQELYLAILRQQRTDDPGPRDGSLAQPRALPAGSRHPAGPPGSAAVSARLVGRDLELAELTAAWAKAAGGEPGVVLIVGRGRDREDQAGRRAGRGGGFGRRGGLGVPLLRDRAVAVPAAGGGGGSPGRHRAARGGAAAAAGR